MRADVGFVTIGGVPLPPPESPAVRAPAAFLLAAVGIVGCETNATSPEEPPPPPFDRARFEADLAASNFYAVPGDPRTVEEFEHGRRNSYWGFGDGVLGVAPADRFADVREIRGSVEDLYNGGTSRTVFHQREGTAGEYVGSIKIYRRFEGDPVESTLWTFTPQVVTLDDGTNVLWPR